MYYQYQNITILLSLLRSIFLFWRAKLGSLTLRMTYIKTCFINMRTQIFKRISQVLYLSWQKVQKLPDLQNTALHVLKNQAPLVSKGSSKFLPSSFCLLPPPALCSGPSASGFKPCHRSDRREGACATHCLPATSSCSHSCASGISYELKPTQWTRCCHCSGSTTLDAVAEGTAVASELLQLSLPGHFSPEDWAPQHWDTTKECYGLSHGHVSGNKYAGWFTAGNTHL